MIAQAEAWTPSMEWLLCCSRKGENDKEIITEVKTKTTTNKQNQIEKPKEKGTKTFTEEISLLRDH